jgi:hypothetical protein
MLTPAARPSRPPTAIALRPAVTGCVNFGPPGSDHAQPLASASPSESTPDSVTDRLRYLALSGRP